jgi:hypothetical protein
VKELATDMLFIHSLLSWCSRSANILHAPIQYLAKIGSCLLCAIKVEIKTVTLQQPLPIATGAEPGNSFLLYRTSNAQP